MIRLRRGAVPPVLVANVAKWTAEYLRRKSGDDTAPAAALTRYRHDEIKAAVTRDCHGKCMYCESKPLAVYPGAVEHIKPKSTFPELVVDWENLGFVCFECNRAKLDQWSDDTPILNPYVDEPSEHLIFFGPLVLERHGSSRGKITIHHLGLNQRSDLLERKAAHIETVSEYLRTWSVETSPALKSVLEDTLRRYASDGSEYAATVRALYETHGLEL